MRLKIFVTSAVLILITGCASGPKNEEFKEGFSDCAMMCKANPEIKEYSQGHGGGFLLLIFGNEERKCACNR